MPPDCATVSLQSAARLAGAGMAEIELRGVTKRWGTFTGVQNLDLQIRDKEFLVLLGPSGKITTVRLNEPSRDDSRALALPSGRFCLVPI